jgi:ribosome maturation factor RimP
MNLDHVKEVLQAAADELGLELVSVRFYHDAEMGDMLEVLIDKDYQITMDEIQKYTDKVNPLLDEIPELDVPYTLDISSGGSLREIPFEDTSKFVDRYLEIKLSKSKETILAKVSSFQGETLNVFYFIKGRKKNLALRKEDVESVHMGYKA